MECPLCNKIFSRQDGLKRHPCYNNKVHECSICKKHFKRKDGLKRHVDNIHKGTRKRQAEDVNYQVYKKRIKEPLPSVSGDIEQIPSMITDDLSHSHTQNTSFKSISTLEQTYCYPEASLEDRIVTYRIDCSENYDISTYLEDVKMKSCNLIREAIANYATGVKIQFLLLACYKKSKTESDISEHTISTSQELVTKHSDLENVFDHLADVIKQKSDKFQKCGGRLIFHNVCHLDININCYKPTFATIADYPNHSHSQNTLFNSVNISEESIPCVETSFKNRIATYFINCTENYDIPTFLEDVKMKACTLIRNTAANYTKGVKIQFILVARYKKLEAESEINELAINARQEIVEKYSELENAFDQLANVIKHKNVEFQQRSSKFIFHSTSHLEININCYEPSFSTTTDYPSQSCPQNTSSDVVNAMEDGTPCVETNFNDGIASYRIDCSHNYDIPTFLKDIKVKSCSLIRDTITKYACVKIEFLLVARYNNPETESETTEHTIGTRQEVLMNYSDLESTFNHLANVINDKSEEFQEHSPNLTFQSTCYLKININCYEATLQTTTNSHYPLSSLKENFRCVQSSFDNRLATHRIDCSEKYDVPTFLKDAKVKSCNLIKNAVVNSTTCVKIQFFLVACYKKSEAESKITERISFNTCQTIVTKFSDFENTFDQLAEVIIDQSEEYQESVSRFTFHSTSHFDIDINCFRPVKGSSSDIIRTDINMIPDDSVDCQVRMEEERIEKPKPQTSGTIEQIAALIKEYSSHSHIQNYSSSDPISSSYIALPKCIEHKKACINIQNNDNACLAWCLVAALHPRSNNNGRITAYPHYSEKIKLGKIKLPVKFEDIPKIEEMNNLSVNVFALTKIGDKFEVIGPVYFTRNKKEFHVNLLLLEKGNRLHYVLIKNLSRLVSSQITGINRKIYLCDGCLQRFRTKDQLDRHCKNNCNHVHTVLPSAFPKPNVNGYMIRENILEFKNYNKKIKVPFVIYANFASLLQRARNTRTEVHVPYSFAYQIVCSFNRKFNKFETYTGLDSASQFLSLLMLEVESLYKKDMKHKKEIKLLGIDRKSFDRTRECYICGLPFLDDDKKIGAAHAGCNINFQTPKFIPVFLHNFGDYDVDLLLRELGTENESIKIIALNKKEYISFSKNINVDQYVDKNGKKMNIFFELRFLDSFRFAPSSIEKLLKSLPEKKFNLLRAKYLPDGYFDLVKRKGVFPRAHMDAYERLDETELPPKEKFINPSTNEEISDDDYEHARSLWNTFNCKNLRDYSNLYMQTDVLLLADIFEYFREVCIKAYNLDPAHYYTAPGLSWDAMLKYTGVKLELFSEEEMLHFVKNNMRGELSQVSLRHAKANNKYMKDHDNNSPSSYLMSWKTDDLYSWAMTQRLPYGGFRWLSEEEIEGFEVLEQSDDADTGYFLEIDVKYPKDLHDRHNDLPFLIDKIVPPSSRGSNRKLTANLYGKKNYVLHYRNLKQALENGLKISKIRRILEFKQSNWLQPYINLNTERRRGAKNDFEKEFYKLMNDSVFRKTIENIDERVDVKLITHWEDLGRLIGARALIAKPNFESVSILGKNSVAIHCKQLKVFYNKPDYISFTVSDLSKTLMYDFYYKKLKERYQEGIKLCYTGTGSFIVHITTDDAYQDVKQNISEFDTSNYPQDNRFDVPLENEGILGLFKDENRGRIQTEFVGLRSKMYADEVEGDETSKRDEDVKNAITFDDYRQRVLAEEQERPTISIEDDKRYVLENGIDTLAWGHYPIRVRRGKKTSLN